MTSKFRIATLALVAASLSLHAQPAAVEQLQNIQVNRALQPPPPSLMAATNAPELYQGENADTGPQRILRLKPRHKYFDILLDSQLFYTDNATYAQQPFDVSSWVFVNTVQAAFTPDVLELGQGHIGTAVGFASQWYNYANNSLESLDFDAQTLFASAKYTLGKWQMGVGVNATRLVNQENYDETYRELMPNLGLQRVIPLNDRMFFALGDLLDYHATEVPTLLGSRSDINDRFDNIASVTFTWQPTRHFIIQPYYRFQYSYYQYNALGGSGRNDYLQGFGITAAYYFNSRISARAFYNFNRRQTSDPFTPAYREMNGGVGATLDISF